MVPGPQSDGPVPWDELRPRRACRWKAGDERVTLLVPRFGRGAVGSLLERWFHPRPYQIHLDAIGTFVWRRMDGTRTAGQIAGELEARFGTRVEPARERLGSFLRTLERGRFLAYGTDAPDPSARGGPPAGEAPEGFEAREEPRRASRSRAGRPADPDRIVP